MLDKYKASRLFKVYNGVTETKHNREFNEEVIESGLMVNPSNLMTYWDKIPNGSDSTGGEDALEIIANLTDDNPYFYYQKDEVTKIPVVRKWTLKQMESCGVGSPKSFRIVEDGKPVNFIVPLNYCRDIYTFHIYTQEGLEVPFGLSNWILDCYSGVLTFYGELPDGIDSAHPPLITCYQYTGGTGYRKDSVGLEGVIVPLTSFEIPANTFSTQGSAKNLLQSIKDSTDKIEQDFVARYGWDGADGNEGVALGFEKVIPLKYSDTKDLTKGYDESADSEIGSVVSRKLDFKISAKKVLSNFTESKMDSKLNFPWVSGNYTDFKIAEVSNEGVVGVKDIPTYLENLALNGVSTNNFYVSFDPALRFEFDSNGVYRPNSLLEEALAVLSEAKNNYIFKVDPGMFEDKPELLNLRELSFFDKLNKKVYGLEFYNISEIYEIPFTTYKYVYVESSATYHTASLKGLFEDFYIKEEDYFQPEVFVSPNLKNLWINSHKKLNIEEGSKLFSKLPETLENIYVYDSMYNTMNITDEKEVKYLTSLSENPKYPLSDGGYSVENEPIEWTGSIEYINEKTPINSVFTLIVRNLGNKKACSIIEDGSESKVIEFNPETDYRVTLTAPISKAIVVLNPRNVGFDTAYEFSVREVDPYVSLWYWNKKTQTYTPFVSKETREYDFGVPVVSAIGKIPPSVYFDSSDVLDFSQDEVVSDYYGNRLFTKVLATEETSENKSADFIVKEKETFYLDQYLQNLYRENPAFEGSIFLRKGFYPTKSKTLVIPPFKGLKLIGEDKTQVKLNLTKLFLSNVQTALSIENIGFGEECTLSVDTSNLKFCAINNIFVKDIQATCTPGNRLFLKDLALNSVEINSSIKTNPKLLGDGEYDIRLDTIIASNLTINCDRVFVKASTFKEASFNAGKTFVSGSAITYVHSKTYGTQIEGCDVRTWDPSIDTLDIPSDANFLMSEQLASGQMYHRYTSFADPFEWDREERKIKIKLDDEVLILNEKGQLTTDIRATRITLDPEDYKRADTAVDPDTGKVIPVTATTLKEGLQDLFLNKADLVKGKVPLKQLPDSVAYGGLHYCGIWSFDDHEGRYPTFEDLNIDLSVEDHITELQPGYFFIVNPPKSELDKALDDDTYSPARNQTSVKGIVYTAGDWVVYEGFKEIKEPDKLICQPVNLAAPASSDKTTILQYSRDNVLTAKVGPKGEEITGPYTAVWSSIQQYYSEENTKNRTRHNVSSLIFFEDHADLYFSDTDSFDFKETFKVEYIEGLFDCGEEGTSPYKTLTQIKIGDYSFDILGTGVSQADTNPNIVTTPYITKDTLNHKVVTRLILRASDEVSAVWANENFGALEGSMSLRPTMVPGWYEDTHLENSTDVLDNIDAVYQILYVENKNVENFGPQFFTKEAVWTKIDRAYQDAAYAILPSLDPDGKNWDWRNFGDGWLDFSGKTITEAFDVINEYLKSILPRKGLILSQLKLTAPKLESTAVYKIDRVNFKVNSKPEKVYLLSQNPEFSSKIEVIPQEEAWKEYAFFSDGATALNIKFNDQVVVSKVLDYNMSEIDTDYGTIKIDDVHKDENMGQGFWKGIQPKLDFKTDGPGEYKVIISTFGKQPWEEIDPSGTQTFEWKIDPEPYKLKDALLELNLRPSLESLTNVCYVSGIPYLYGDFSANFAFKVSHALKDYVCTSNFLEFNEIENGELLSITTAIVNDTVEGFEDYNDLTALALVRIKALPGEALTSINFTDITLKGALESISKKFRASLEEFPFRVFEKLDENERVYSGNPEEMYPAYDEAGTLTCGSAYESSKLLMDSDYKGELQKAFTFEDGKVKAVYRNPKGDFVQLSYVPISYNGITSSSEYRWATFRSFGGEKVVLDESNGFYLNLNPTDPELWKSKLNYKTGSLDDIKIFVKVVDKENKTETPWFDANKAYAFYDKPTKDGDGVSYAGASDHLKRRVTFGTDTYSGEVIVRIGLKSDSDLEFLEPTISRIV